MIFNINTYISILKIVGPMRSLGSVLANKKVPWRLAFPD